MKSNKHAWIAIFILTLANISSFIDRQILALLVKPIKRDLHLSDTEMSLLMGLSFAMFYSLFGIMIGRLADTKNRTKIIMLGISIWSVMTSLCAGIGNYLQFFLARMGVGVGESTLSPSANSLIADLFPKEKLGRATSVFTLGVFLGSGLATLIGSGIVAKLPTEGMVSLPILGDIFPWQMIFLYIGIPGFLIALLFLFIKEPARTNSLQKNGAIAKLSLSESFKIIFTHKKAFLLICFTVACQAFVNYGMNAWIPTFVNRTYGWEVPRAGFFYGIVSCLAAISGALTGGWLADKWTNAGKTDGRLRVGIVGMTLGLLGLLVGLAPKAEWAILLTALPVFGMAMPYGAATAAIQEIMPNQVRATASAVLLFIINLLGMGLGPFVVAFFTDTVFKDESMIRYSLMLLFIIGGSLGLILSYMSLKPYRQIFSNREGSLRVES
ncbi:MAG: MFS transporter [Leadbetterella sp.]|nr:MFS transporter [Leadbetterella sp.]